MTTIGKQSFTYYKDQIDVPDLLRTMKDLHGYSFEEPFYICDLSDIINKFFMWKKYMPRITPYYAVKCNCYTPILEVLEKLGAGFDCASANEIIKIQSLGVQGNRIVYANPTKQISHLLLAKDRGIKKLTFDNECELYKIKKYYPDAELLIRIRCDAKKAILTIGSKFGCDPKIEALDLIALAIRLDLKLVGVSFHVGSGCKDFPVFEKAIAAARKLFDYSEKLGMPLSILDIGGGFSADKVTFLATVNVVNKSIDKYFSNNDVTIISEPGRYFAAEAFTLVTKIHSLRETKVGGKPYYMYYINTGIHSAFSYMLYGAKAVKPEIIKEDDGKMFKSTIWGRTCDPLDKPYENVLMPKMDINDLIIFRNMGAYTISLASTFNGFALADIKLFLSVKHEHITPSSDDFNHETNVQINQLNDVGRISTKL